MWSICIGERICDNERMQNVFEHIIRKRLMHNFNRILHIKCLSYSRAHRFICSILLFSSPILVLLCVSSLSRAIAKPRHQSKTRTHAERREKRSTQRKKNINIYYRRHNINKFVLLIWCKIFRLQLHSMLIEWNRLNWMCHFSLYAFYANIFFLRILYIGQILQIASRYARQEKIMRFLFVVQSDKSELAFVRLQCGPTINKIICLSLHKLLEQEIRMILGHGFRTVIMRQQAGMKYFISLTITIDMVREKKNRHCFKLFIRVSIWKWSRFVFRFDEIFSIVFFFDFFQVCQNKCAAYIDWKLRECANETTEGANVLFNWRANSGPALFLLFF